MYTHASQSWSRACCSIHHHDEALGSHQSRSVLHQCDSGGSRREGAPCPPAAQAGGTQHVATLSYMSHCHSINPAPGGERKHSSSEQTRPHKHLSCARQWQNKTLTPLWLGVSALPVWLSGWSAAPGHSESPTGGRLTCSSVRVKPRTTLPADSFSCRCQKSVFKVFFVGCSKVRERRVDLCGSDPAGVLIHLEGDEDEEEE